MTAHVKTEDFEVEYNNLDTVVVSGVLRLPTPVAYNEIFQPIKQCVENTRYRCVVDLSDVSFLNSSGITAIARLIVLARSLEKPIVFIGKKEVPWHTRSLVSLQRLWDEVEIELH